MIRGTMAGRIVGGQRSGHTRRAHAERAALVAWLPELRQAVTDRERCLVLARAVRAGIRMGYERAYNRYARGER
jgi:hypothetical protein